MRIRVTPETGPEFEADLFDFVSANDLPPDDVAAIVGDLHGSGQHIMGGGAAPFVTLERVR